MESDNSRTNRRCKNSEGSLANYAIDEPEFTAKLGLDFAAAEASRVLRCRETDQSEEKARTTPSKVTDIGRVRSLVSTKRGSQRRLIKAVDGDKISLASGETAIIEWDEQSRRWSAVQKLQYDQLDLKIGLEYVIYVNRDDRLQIDLPSTLIFRSCQQTALKTLSPLKAKSRGR
jgi:hypothetical protein